ncbi:MAG: PIN domain-containing protein [Ferruginibacter sp.]
MVYKIFFDINIVLDFFISSRKCHKDAVNVFSLVEEKYLSGYLSESVLNTTAYLLQKDYPVDQLRKILYEMTNIFTVLECSGQIFKNAYQSKITDIEDAVLFEIALHHKMEYFVTNNIKDYKKGNITQLPVVTAKELLSLF